MQGHRVIKSLTRKGNVILGVGCYSAALKTSKENLILKIGTTLDDPWLDYYNLIIKDNKENVFVPRIEHFVAIHEQNYYVVKMEKLYPVEMEQYNLISALAKYMIGNLSEADLAYEIQSYSDNIPDFDQLITLLNTIKDNSSWEDEEDTQINRKIDFHNGNFMLREDKTLVLIDPWCEWEIEDDFSEWATKHLQWGE